MSNYFRLKPTELISSIRIFLLVLSPIIMLSGCGGDSKYTISGRVTTGGTALSGVTITLSGDSSVIATTDENGNYTFNDLPSGIFTVTPSQAGLAFSPPSRNVWLYGIDASGFDFSGSAEVRIAAKTHTVTHKSDGTVWTWGSNSKGQLGDGTTTDRATPVQVGGLTGVTAVTAGYEYTAALKSDGTVWTWGSNSKGQLGDGTTTDRATPVQVGGLTGVTAITAGYEYTAALKSDGTVWTWGSNSKGQLGDGTTTDRTTPVQVGGLTSVTAIAAAYEHTLALKSTATSFSVWVWGSNSKGQLGDGTTTDRTTPVQVGGLTGVTAIAAGHDFTMVLKSDGTVWTWGSNSKGQLGDGTTTDRTTPVQVSGLTGVTAIAGGYEYAVALRVDNTVWTWGSNSRGQLGDGTSADRGTPGQVQPL